MIRDLAIQPTIITYLKVYTIFLLPKEFVELTVKLGGMYFYLIDYALCSKPPGRPVSEAL